MSTTIDEIAEFLDEHGLSYGRHETDAAILVGFRLEPGTTSYRDREGDAHFALLIRVQEDGGFLSVSMPWTWNLADCPHKPAVFEALLAFQAGSKLIRFDYDPDLGEVRANAELGLDDSLLTSMQFHRLVRSVGNAVLQLDPVIRHAMCTGEVDMQRITDTAAGDEEHASLQALAAEAGGIDALEQLVCGEPVTDGDEPEPPTAG